MKGIIIIPDIIWTELTSTSIHPICRCNNQQGYFPLFLCHGHGRVSEPNTQITAVILIETFEWISKVYTEHIATDRLSLGQPHYYFLRLWKGKVLTDLLEVTLVFSPHLFAVTVTECVISLPRTQWENNFVMQSKEYFAVSGIWESAYGSLSISQLGSLPRPWSFLPREPVWDPYHFSRNKSSWEATANQNFARMLVVSALPFLKILQLWSALEGWEIVPTM